MFVSVYVVHELFVPKEILCDDNMAKFLLAAGKQNNWTPHTKKKVHAALRWQLDRQGIGSIDNSEMFPLFNRAKKVKLFSCELF